MSSATIYGRSDFLREFECVPEKEWEFNGRAATWAPSQAGPRMWDGEDESIDLPDDNAVQGNVPESALALTSDDRFLAVALNANVRIYNVETLQLSSQHPSHPHNVSSLHFRPMPSCSTTGPGHEYLLVSTTRPHGESSKIYLSRLDAAGQVIEEGSSKSSQLAEGNLPWFGSGIWSPDGGRMLYITESEAGMSEVVIWDAINLREVCRLQGHRDSITSASWSPDSKLIATASWDRTYGIWVALSGLRRHNITTTGQNWCCKFLSDGRHLLVSGGPTTYKPNTTNRIAIYDVETAKIVVSFESPENIHLKPLPRVLAPHPTRDLVIVPVGRFLLAWTPFETAPSEDTFVQRLLTLGKVESSKATDWAEFTVTKWVDEGRKLVVQGRDETIFVWELERRRKWRFQRPKGRGIKDGHGTDALLVRRKGEEWVLSMGEGRVRLWKL